MLSLLLAALLTQATMSPTSDLSTNRVRATGAAGARSLRDHLRTLPDVSWDAVTASSIVIRSRGSTTPRGEDDRWSDVSNVSDFGATGDGTTDDSAAFQAAANTGKTVYAPPGKTYAVGDATITSVAEGQVFSLQGATLRLRNSALSKGVLRLNHAHARVLGGTFDMNVAGNGSDTDWGYNTWAVFLTSDSQSVLDTRIKNSYGIGIKGAPGISNAIVRDNRITNARVFGIYFDSSALTANDAVGSQVSGNIIDASMIATSENVGGIYIASSPPYTYQSRGWVVSQNRVIGPTGIVNTEPVGITVRGTSGAVLGNYVYGWAIGISVDLSKASDSRVIGNYVEGASGDGYGIEVNGGGGVIASNRVIGGNNGIIGSTQHGTGTTLDNLLVTGNVVTGINPGGHGVWIYPASGDTAHHVRVMDNTITWPSGSGAGVLLTGDCKYSAITGNIIAGPGGAVANSRGIYLDGVNSDILITSNRIEGVERAVGAYNAAAVAQQRIVFAHNDVSHDLGSSSAVVLVAAEGSATIGTGVQVISNYTGSQDTYRDDLYDLATRTMVQVSNAYNTPEGSVTAGPGSLWITINAQNPSLFVKQSGTGSTGWVGK